jgi:Flp pilus assembly pilin Flp
MSHLLARFLDDSAGNATSKYGLIVAALAAAIVTVALGIATNPAATGSRPF